MMEFYEVPFKNMLRHDFPYQGALFYNNANADTKNFQLATGKAKSTLFVLLTAGVCSVSLAYQIIHS